MENENLETSTDTATPELEAVNPAATVEETTVDDSPVSETESTVQEVTEAPVLRKEFREDGIRTSSIFPSAKEAVELKQNKMSTPFLLIFLVLVFFILKSFIYKKDDKRHGK